MWEPGWRRTGPVVFHHVEHLRQAPGRAQDSNRQRVGLLLPFECTAGQGRILWHQGPTEALACRSICDVRNANYFGGGASTLAVAKKTKAGCDCRRIWGLHRYGAKSRSDGVAELYLNGECGSPDGDAQGSWCFIDTNSCTQPPAGPKTDSSPDEWDYCSPTAPVVGGVDTLPPHATICK